MAYILLALPPSSRIHPVFHISVLKPHKGDKKFDFSSYFQGQPSDIIAESYHRQMNHLKGPIPTDQVLIRSEHSPPKEATWENIADLKDKVDLEAGGCYKN